MTDASLFVIITRDKSERIPVKRAGRQAGRPVLGHTALGVCNQSMLCGCCTSGKLFPRQTLCLCEMKWYNVTVAISQTRMPHSKHVDQSRLDSQPRWQVGPNEAQGVPGV